MMYQFEYILNENDYLEFNIFHLSNAPAFKKTLLILRLIVPVMLIILLLLSFLDNKDSIFLITQSILSVIVSVVWFFADKPLIRHVIKLNIKMIKKDGKLPYGENVLIKFDEDFFIETTNETETKTKYASIERITIGNNAIYIYVSSIQAYIIPFSVFENKEQRDAFWNFINHNAAIGVEGVATAI